MYLLSVYYNMNELSLILFLFSLIDELLFLCWATEMLNV